MDNKYEDKISSIIRELVKKCDRERITDMRRKGAPLSTITASRWIIQDKQRRKENEH